MKQLLSFFLFAIHTLNVFADPNPTLASIVSAQDGNWNNPTTWVGGVVPDTANCNLIVINHNVAITTYTKVMVKTEINNVSLTVESGVHFVFDATCIPCAPGSVDFISNFMYFDHATLINKGTMYIYGRIKFWYGAFIQNTANASTTFRLGNGAYSGSLSQGYTAFQADFTNLEQFNNGLLHFIESSYYPGAFCFSVNMCTSNKFGSENSNLIIKFGGQSNTTNLFFINGFEIMLSNSMKLYSRKILLDTGTNPTEVLYVSGYYETAISTDTLQIENGEVRSTYFYPNNAGLKNFTASRVINKGIFTNTNFTWQPQNINTQSLVVENGIWRNNVSGSIKNIDDFSIVSPSNLTSLKIGMPNFHCNKLDLGGKLFLNNDTLIVDDYNILSGNNNYLITNGTGVLKLNIPNSANLNNLTFFVPIGTAATPLQLGMYRKNPSTESDDYFYISCRTPSNAVNLNQCIPFEITVNEETPGGNDGLHFCPSIPDTSFKKEHAIFLSKLYNKTGTVWNENTQMPFTVSKVYYDPISTAFLFNRDGGVILAIRGTFSFASGRGLSATQPYQATTKTGGTNNWSLPTTWADNSVPTSNDIIYIKNTDSVYVDINANCKNAQTSGSIKIPQNKALTIGNTGGDNSEIFNNGKFTIDTLATLNLNGRLYSEVAGTFGLKGGTINIDPNSGAESTSVTLTNYKNSPNPFHVAGYNDSLWGNINFKDPLYGGYLANTYNCVPPYFVIYNNEEAKPINFVFGDNVGTSSSNDFFNLNSGYVSRSIDNVTINLQNEQRDTLFEYNSYGLTANNLTIKTGSAYIPDPNRVFLSDQISDIYGNIIVNGIFKGGINFKGNNPQTLSGVGKITNEFGFLQYNNANHPININVIDTIRATNNGILSFKKGSFILNNSNVEFTDTYSNSSTHFAITNGTGRLIAKIDAATASANGYYFPVGSNDTSFTPLTIFPNAGHITDKIGVQVKDSVFKNGTSGATYFSNVVNKTWYINEATIEGSNINITAQWDTSNQLQGFTNNSCGLSHYVGSTWDAFTPAPAINFYDAAYYVTRNNITSFSPFAVINSLTSLPVTWLQINGIVNTAKQAQIIFKVQEQDVKNYTIQKSYNGTSFSNIKTIASVGNGENNYTSIDDAPLTKATYYRIKQQSNNGNITYSKIIGIKNMQTEIVNVQPTISSSNVTLIIKDNTLLQTKATVYNSIGQLVMQVPLQSNYTNINVRNLQAGKYYIKLQDGTILHFVKE